MELLDRRASGPRHARWLREIVATGQAHLALNPNLSEAQRAALAAELVLIEAVLASLLAANAPYQAFLDGAYVETRAAQRVANYLCDGPLAEAVEGVRTRRRDAEAAVPSILQRLTRKVSLSKALRLGHVATVELVRGAADVLALLPPATFPFAPALERSLDAAADRLDALNRRVADEIDPQRAPLKVAVERAVLAARETLQQVNGRLRTHFAPSFIDSLYPELAKGSARLADDPDEDDDDTDAPVAPPTP